MARLSFSVVIVTAIAYVLVYTQHDILRSDKATDAPMQYARWLWLVPVGLLLQLTSAEAVIIIHLLINALFSKRVGSLASQDANWTDADIQRLLEGDLGGMQQVIGSPSADQLMHLYPVIIGCTEVALFLAIFSLIQQSFSLKRMPIVAPLLFLLVDLGGLLPGLNRIATYQIMELGKGLYYGALLVIIVTLRSKMHFCLKLLMLPIALSMYIVLVFALLFNARGKLIHPFYGDAMFVLILMLLGTLIKDRRALHLPPKRCNFLRLCFVPRDRLLAQQPSAVQEDSVMGSSTTLQTMESAESAQQPEPVSAVVDVAESDENAENAGNAGNAEIDPNGEQQQSQNETVVDVAEPEVDQTDDHGQMGTGYWAKVKAVLVDPQNYYFGLLWGLLLGPHTKLSSYNGVTNEPREESGEIVIEDITETYDPADYQLVIYDGDFTLPNSHYVIHVDGTVARWQMYGVLTFTLLFGLVAIFYQIRRKFCYRDLTMLGFGSMLPLLLIIHPWAPEMSVEVLSFWAFLTGAARGIQFILLTAIRATNDKIKSADFGLAFAILIAASVSACVSFLVFKYCMLSLVIVIAISGLLLSKHFPTNEYFA